ncbi:hypothetical protein T440DRAFT_292286 [Plenodomus tracheiphilus IPT5]|uniref:Uncharacterized protein n=1 Tax=Plenodomus tracheiphilus IPT5 TaxID=1408161 RepID=A0A6A7BF30_9PLEO|nr:hypothetical protein T440DRAFT_292286 [Plenodomus tracheiphilus IPT5]
MVPLPRRPLLLKPSTNNPQTRVVSELILILRRRVVDVKSALYINGKILARVVSYARQTNEGLSIPSTSHQQPTQPLRSARPRYRTGDVPTTPTTNIYGHYRHTSIGNKEQHDTPCPLNNTPPDAYKPLTISPLNPIRQCNQASATRPHAFTRAHDGHFFNASHYSTRGNLPNRTCDVRHSFFAHETWATNAAQPKWSTSAYLQTCVSGCGYRKRSPTVCQLRVCWLEEGRASASWRVRLGGPMHAHGCGFPLGLVDVGWASTPAARVTTQDFFSSSLFADGGLGVSYRDFVFLGEEGWVAFGSYPLLFSLSKFMGWMEGTQGPNRQLIMASGYC